MLAKKTDAEVLLQLRGILLKETADVFAWNTNGQAPAATGDHEDENPTGTRGVATRKEPVSRMTVWSAPPDPIVSER